MYFWSNKCSLGEKKGVLFVHVYIPPHANVRSAVQKLADQITKTEQQHPDSVLIILGDFNKANLSRELPKYRQHITCPTRDSNILDHCYTARCISLCPTGSFGTLWSPFSSSYTDLQAKT